MKQIQHIDFEAWFQLAQDAFAVISEEGEFLSCNLSFLTLLGYAKGKEEIRGQTLHQLIHPQYVPSLEHTLESILSGQETASCSIQLRNSKDKALIHLNFQHDTSNSILFVKAENLPDTSHHILDVDEVEQEFQQVLYAMSHDFGAPVRHIVGYADRLNQKAGLTDQQQGYLSKLKGASLRLQSMITDILIFYRIRSQIPKRASINLEEVVATVQQEIQRDVDNQSILWKISPLPQVYADAERMEILFRCLLSNAVKFSKQDGADSQVIELSAEEQGDRYLITIRDNGIGFKMKYAEKLFAMFQHLHPKSQYDGNGMGLFIAKKIIQQHGGTIWAEGLVNEGATFYFTLQK